MKVNAHTVIVRVCAIHLVKDIIGEGLDTVLIGAGPQMFDKTPLFEGFPGPRADSVLPSSRRGVRLFLQPCANGVVVRAGWWACVSGCPHIGIVQGTPISDEASTGHGTAHEERTGVEGTLHD